MNLKKDDKGFYYIEGQISEQTKKDLEYLNDSVQCYSNMNKIAYRVQLTCIWISIACGTFLLIKYFIES
jgi:hypothetical protein